MRADPRYLLSGLGDQLGPVGPASATVECARLLLRAGARGLPSAHLPPPEDAPGELLSLDSSAWQDNKFTLPLLPEIATTTTCDDNSDRGRWSCRCPRMTLEEMRQWLQAAGGSSSGVLQGEMNSGGPCPGQEAALMLMDGGEINMPFHVAAQGRARSELLGWRLTRKKLARRVNLARKFKRLQLELGGALHTEENNGKQTRASLLWQLPGHLQSAALYELESLARQTNHWLELLLDQLARRDSRQLLKILKRADGQDDDNFTTTSEHLGPYGAYCSTSAPHTAGLPIGARLATCRDVRGISPPPPQVRLRGRSIASASSGSSQDSGISLVVNLTSSSRAASGAEEDEPRGQKAVKLVPLERWLAFRSSVECAKLVAFSCQLFQQLLSQSHLLRLELDPNRDANDTTRHPRSLNQLRLFACVECQKLRAALRFQWLPRCMWLALGEHEGQLPAKQTTKPTTSLPPVVAAAAGHMAPPPDEQLEALARLMGHLLRRHFLEPALDLWLGAVERELRQAPARQDSNSGAARLLVPVELEERSSGGGGPLAATSAERALREALEFVCHELASACSRLPRLECQLAAEGDDEDPNASVSIEVVAQGDELLARKRAQLARQVREIDRWTHAEYSQVLEVINKFRLGAGGESHTTTSTMTEDQLQPPLGVNCLRGFEVCEPLEHTGAAPQPAAESARAHYTQLQATRVQVQQLDALERQLRLRLATRRTFGQLLQLDLTGLNERLLRIVRQERLLLVRLGADELWRLAEKLRLQFDELEINIDLETAIEDYLNERWQVKQSQAPDLEQQILLDDDELDDEAPQMMLPEREQEPKTIEHEPKTIEHEPIEQQQHQLDSGEPPELGQVVGGGGGGGGPAGTSTQRAHAEEDEFLNALVSNTSPNVAHLFAMSDQGAGVGGGAAVAEQEQRRAGGPQVAPLIESRLLLERYVYLNKFVRLELPAFEGELEFLLSRGLEFLCELLPPSGGAAAAGPAREPAAQQLQLEPDQLELVGELAWRARDFSRLLTEALARLCATRRRLAHAAALRARVLARTLLEFVWLARRLAARRLEPLELDANGGSGGGGPSDASIKQLDLIQETASWSQRLATRWEFLSSQNELARRELSLLLVECGRELAELAGQMPRLTVAAHDEPFLPQFESSCEREFELRAGALELWRAYTRQANQFWHLIEEFETQQVKWLNSDAKKLEYEQVVGGFRGNFLARCGALKSEVEEIDSGGQKLAPHYEVLRQNLAELERRLAHFARVCLPVFKFLTNKHLTREHWAQLEQQEFLLLAGGGGGGDNSTTSGEGQAPRSGGGNRPPSHTNYTTVAQLLDHLSQICGGQPERQAALVAQLDRMAHAATREHELGQLLVALEAEGARADQRPNRSMRGQLNSLDACARLDGWSERELATAASRFIQLKLSSGSGGSGGEATDRESRERPPRDMKSSATIDALARKLVACHSAVRRYFALRNSLNLDLAAASLDRKCQLPSPHTRHPPLRKQQVVVLRSGGCQRGVAGGSALLIEFLRLFTESWLASESRLRVQYERMVGKLAASELHLEEIDKLLERVEHLQACELQGATREAERQLARLQRESLRLDEERELLATRESAALERQRAALRARDLCVRQVTERAIPALRAATRALDCLGDGQRALRALRSYRPSPPLAVRLVIEAVCLLRNVVCVGGRAGPSESLPGEFASLGAPLERREHTTAAARSERHQTQLRTFPTSPARHFDHARGRLVADYWPVAWRTLNALHSAQFLADLRRVSSRTIPRDAMQQIRRRYLGRPELRDVGALERVSREAALLARWLLAVDVFDRVLNIVRPNYGAYLRAEETLGDLLVGVSDSRRQMDALGRQLESLEESIGWQVGRRVELVDLIEDCLARSRRLAHTRQELLEQIARQQAELARLQARLDHTAERCLWQAARLVYLEGEPEPASGGDGERAALEQVMRRELARS